MKKLVFIGFLLPSILFSTTYNTITIDGTSDFATDEDFSTSTGGMTAYITWDASNIYVGMNSSDVPWVEGGSEKVIFIYFDTDPNSTPTNGTGSTSSISWGITNTLPFSANYMFWWKKQAWQYGLRNSSDWTSAVSYTGGAPGRSGNMVEFKIPLTDIGSPSQVHMLLYFQDSDKGANNWVWANAPSSNSGGQGAQTLGHYFGFNLTSGESPDDAGNVDQSLPVELSAFSARSSSQGVELSWTTDSEIENQGFILSRKMEGSSWDEIASFASHQALQGQGSTTNASNYSFVDTDVRDGISYTYQLSDVDYGGNVTHHSDQARTITYVNPGAEVRPQTLDLVRLYPNPFNPSVTLSYDLLEMTDLNVSVYDLTGELVWSHSIASHPAGQNYTLTWNGNDRQNSALPSGIYLVYIQAGRQSLSQKVTLLR